MGTPLEDARRRIDDALAAFRRAADAAIALAAKPRLDVVSLAQARTQATFALAAVGASFKAALEAARPGVDDLGRDVPPPPRV